MSSETTFLHLTDPHISGSGVPFERDDHKVTIPGVDQAKREEVLDLLLRRLAERLRSEHRTLDGVLFSGDAQNRGAPGGHERVFELLTEHLGALGITPDRIVATPGNHDVPRGAPPSSPVRYESFTRVWRDRGCKVPWLDGIDKFPPTTAADHYLASASNDLAVFPINTANWSHVTSILPPPLDTSWDAIPHLVAPSDPGLEEMVRSQLQALAQFDMARVSGQQLEALRTIVNSAPPPGRGRQLRIVVMHHHLRSPSLREEVKPFADISNLEQVRAFLRDSEINVVIHGHKHEQSVFFDHVYSGDGDDMHRALVISGGTFSVGREHDAARLITFSGLPYTPEVKVEALALPRAGAGWAMAAPAVRRLWATSVRSAEAVVIAPYAPIIIEGTDLDDVYARARAAAEVDAKHGILIVHLDLPSAMLSESLPLPIEYPAPDDLQGHARAKWLVDLVQWWQLERSQLEHRIPYLHGSRLRRYGGKIDQIERVIALLRSKSTTRAIAVLLDPFRDFNPDGVDEEFASFCLVQFRRRDGEGGRFLDAIAYYRAQEFERWWPINVAELRYLQCQICEQIGCRTGRITTIAADARTISRSPTQVAMPIVDRWLDQAPERLHLLADSLIRRAIGSAMQGDAVKDWLRSLRELRAATDAYNSDGVPVAIEGLRILASYLRASAEENDSDVEAMADELINLANVNELFGHSGRDRIAFDLWAPVARRFVETLQQITEERVGSHLIRGASATRLKRAESQQLFWQMRNLFRHFFPGKSGRQRD